MDQTEHIHYGSLITLHTHDLHFLFSHGFIDTNLYLKSASDYDFIGNVFRIIPSSMYTAQSEVLASISEITDDDHIHRLEDIIEAEIESNLLSYKNLKGKSIKFGSLIQLEHFKSHKFLSIKSNQSADIEKENIKTSLEDYGGAHSIFKIQPCFNYQKEGNLYVKNNDKIILEITLPNLNKCLYLHRSTGLFTSVLNVGVQSSLEVNASFEQKSQWVVDVYSNCNLTENQVCCGDYLWIVPSEEKFCLGGFGKRFKLCFSENHTDTNGL